uniref:Pre-mRNA-splicing factor ISY1 homolog n=1 Tax=Capra hircus TaxID=9925 RepID=A0A8C2RNU4_CAPHI
MARNAEKAMTALARFRQAQLEEGKVKERRPFLASECTELPKAEKWRRQIIGEISKKVAQIQNAGLGEFRIRDLNDEINKLLREKGHWEVRIKELGGPDYGLQIWDTAGQERFRTITQSYYRSANGAILAYDITKRDSFLSVPRWIEDVRKYAGSSIVQLLIGNKSDLGELREVPLAEAQGLAEHYDILCAIETSAKDSSNVEEAFVRVATELVVRHGGPRLSEKGADHIQLDSKDVAESWGCGC